MADEKDQKIYKKISQKHDADIFIFNGAISNANADSLIYKIRNIREKKKNCVLVITTYGGDADSGFRMIRHIQRNYTKLIVYILGYCKSAGTLVAIGGDEIIMSDFGELGPLDVQMSKDDELTNTSGLSYLQSLLFLRKQTFDFFEEYFIQLKEHSGYTITTKTAGEISANLAVGILAPISEQLDPLKLGEVQRAISIASQYGHRICRIKKEAIVSLITKYPNHSFVIDFEEMALDMKLDKSVKFINKDEEDFELSLLPKMRTPIPSNDAPLILCLYNSEFDKPKPNPGENSNEKNRKKDVTKKLAAKPHTNGRAQHPEASR